MARKTAKKQRKKQVRKQVRKQVKRPATVAPGGDGVEADGLRVPSRGVRVRMYRHGFGDCFLLSFGRGDDRALHMVIDCGLLPRAPSEEGVRRAVENIATATGGVVDVLVCTHEHADHLSGFMHAREAWDRIDIRELWFAWTEDPDDSDARRLREQREQRLKGLAAAQPRLRAAGGGPWAAAAAQEVNAALSFFGAAGSKTSTAAALGYVRERVARPRYWAPGDVVTRDDLSNVRFFVMGPPRDEEKLKKDKPSGRHPEVYHARGGLAVDAAFFAAAGGGVVEGADEEERRSRAERSQPFEEAFRIREEFVAKPPKEEKVAEYLHRLYHAPTRADVDSSFVGAREIARVERTTEQGWRRIDTDWLGAGGALALKLDSDTNNTSLVLAIELGDRGDVLLFPGDAQVGSWLSWDECDWPGVRRERPITAADLLARTVLYKVGHHGSHNATLKERGLELMTSPRLVAMIPVDEKVAKGQGTHGWQMPFRPLMDALEKRTSGRVLRLDTGMPERGSATKAAWAKFEKAVRVTPLFIDYVVE